MEWISLIFGAGGLLGMVTAILTYRTNKRERRIQWYDRAIDEIERLEKKLENCHDEKLKYREKYYNELDRRRDSND